MPNRRTRTAGRARALLAALALAAALPGVARPQEARGAPARSDATIERGRYLTHEVAMCVQCHTPRLADGALDETRLFAGAPMPIESPFAGRAWALQAPAIRGAGHLSDADLMSLLTSGRRTTGYTPLPPMPPFRLTKQDATAVIAYLRSLDAAPR